MSNTSKSESKCGVFPEIKEAGLTKELADTTHQSETSALGVIKDDRIAISRNP